MIKQAILKPDFVSKMGRMDYLKVNLVFFAFVMVGAIVAGGTMGLLEGSAIGPLVGVVLALAIMVAVFWMLYVSVSIHVKRFRDMGMSETSTLVIATVGFFIANNVFPLVFLIPLFWPPKTEAE